MEEWILLRSLVHAKQHIQQSFTKIKLLCSLQGTILYSGKCKTEYRARSKSLHLLMRKFTSQRFDPLTLN